jgi:hypothetical protein
VLHKAQLAHTCTSTARILSQSLPKPQNYTNQVPITSYLPKSNNKLEKISVQQPAQPAHDSLLAKIQNPNAIPLENLDLPSKPKPKKWILQLHNSIPHLEYNTQTYK